MKKLSKGEITYHLILSEAREVFNAEGINMTLKELSTKMGVTVGKITNHFPTKDHLFVGLSKQYQLDYTELMSSFDWNDEYSMQKLHELTGLIMDLQFRHRCLLLFVCATGMNQHLMIQQIKVTWKENLSGFQDLISALIQFGLLKKEAIEEGNFSVIRFQFINLFTTWLVSLTIYDNDTPYTKTKAVYQKGILYCLYPFFTSKGLTQLSTLAY
jgi:AcrR family transcriptional regulator